MDGGRGQLSIVPTDVHGESAAGAQAGDFPFLPCIGQRWQQVNDAVLTLQQHFADSGSAAKISVYLKRRMRIK